MNQEIQLKQPESVEQAVVWLAEAIQWAYDRSATDMHFFPSELEARLWVRLDGELREVCRYSHSIHERMVARLKVLGRCTDYDGELVQEGRFTLNGRADAGEARLSIIPTLRGDKAVVRLLGGAGRFNNLEQLGFSLELIEALRATLDRPQGMLIAIGPSGCGKSTALYALLHDLNGRAGHPLSIVTVEDPIEQSMEFAAQVGVNPARGLTFANGLKGILRQDPEIIMIGEIRDPETSTTALQAALTGHCLLSSMHTLNASEAIVRLQQMGSPPFVISSALAGILNLRLVKKLCPSCKNERKLTEEEQRWLPETSAWPSQTIAESDGCEECLGGGHLGRTGIGEWLVPTTETASALQQSQSAARIQETLSIAVSARPAALSLLQEQMISPVELRRLNELTSITCFQSQGSSE